MTKNRETIYRLIRDSDEHMTAEQIFQLARRERPGIAMATVYNNLNALADEGKIRRVHIQGEADRFDRTTREHEHMICDRCGKILDIGGIDLRRKIEEAMHVPVTSLELNVHFICDDCQQAAAQANHTI